MSEHNDRRIGKIAFVTPWYGDDIPGGAEAELRGLVKHLILAGMEAEILTTCVKEFLSDWNTDYYEPGEYNEGDVPVRRFRVRKRKTGRFDAVNAKLMRGERITDKEENTYIEEMINSPDMYSYIETNSQEYSLFVFIPYMFGTTYYGIKACPEKAVMIPCFHDEAYIYMDVFKSAFEIMKGMIFLAYPEMELAKRVFDLKSVRLAAIGGGVDTDVEFDAASFRDRFGIKDDFILYAGRKDTGKNVELLIRYFEQYRKEESGSSLKLVLIGGGRIDIPAGMKKEIIDLGFVDKSDKYNAYAAALSTCQPSVNESFSIVIMESWICGRPVLVHDKCAVTQDFVRRANGGLYFNSFYEFKGCIEYLLNNRTNADLMGENGREFVNRNFSWNVIVEKYREFFNGCLI